MIEPAEHVVVVAARKRQLDERRIRDVPRRAAPEHAALEQVVLAAAARLCDPGRRIDSALVLEQALEHADRRVERRTHTARRLAVPAAVGELLTNEALRETALRPAEVATERERAAVDARLDLALEERLAAELRVPPEAGREARHRRIDGLVRRIDARCPQQEQRVQRRQPQRVIASVPRAVGILPGEDLGAERLAGNARAPRPPPPHRRS